MRLFQGAIWQYNYALVLVAFLGVLILKAVVAWMPVRSTRTTGATHHSAWIA